MSINLLQINYMGCLIDDDKYYFSYQVDNDCLKCHCFSRAKAEKIKAALVENGYGVITTNYGWYVKLGDIR